MQIPPHHPSKYRNTDYHHRNSLYLSDKLVCLVTLFQNHDAGEVIDAIDEEVQRIQEHGCRTGYESGNRLHKAHHEIQTSGDDKGISGRCFVCMFFHDYLRVETSQMRVNSSTNFSPFLLSFAERSFRPQQRR